VNHTSSRQGALTRQVRERLRQSTPQWNRLRDHIRGAAGYPASEARGLTRIIRQDPLIRRRERKNLAALRRQHRRAYLQEAKEILRAWKFRYRAWRNTMEQFFRHQKPVWDDAIQTSALIDSQLQRLVRLLVALRKRSRR
jgi:hypothetical protein